MRQARVSNEIYNPIKKKKYIRREDYEEFRNLKRVSDYLHKINQAEI